jgi:hypothetical protein
MNQEIIKRETFHQATPTIPTGVGMWCQLTGLAKQMSDDYHNELRARGALRTIEETTYQEVKPLELPKGTKPQSNAGIQSL